MTDSWQALVDDGNAYLQRNRAGIGNIHDPVMEALDIINATHPITRALEVGCSTGFRLEKIRNKYGAACFGLEAGGDPVREGLAQYPSINLEQGLAPDGLHIWAGSKFDCIILGFFMYLLPRPALFELAAAVDELLADNGHLVVFDFMFPSPMSSEYLYNASLTTYKMDPSAPWLWSPTYRLVSRTVYSLQDSIDRNDEPENWKTLDVLRKMPITTAYPRSTAVRSEHERTP